MITHNIDFATIYEFPTKEEAREFWRDNPDKRGLIWLTEEIETCLLADYHVLEHIHKIKLENPGTFITKEIFNSLR